MRISSNMIFDANVAALSQQQAQLLKTQQQVATGRRVMTPADDPVAAARALDIAQSDAMNTQYASNRNAARHTLSLAESTLQSVTSLLQDVRTAVVGAGNGSLNNSDRKTIATELNGRLQELVGLANSTDGLGNYLFAGYQSKNQPFMDTPAGMGYFGDDGLRMMQVGASRQMSATDSGADIFMRIKNGNGTFVTQAAATNTGTGTIGLGAVANPAALTGATYTIEFGTRIAQAAAGNVGTGAITTPEVVNPAALTTNNYSVVFDATGANFDVVDTTSVPNVTVLAAQPFTSGQPIAFDGLQFNIQGTPAANDVFTVSPPVGDAYTVTNNATGLPVPGMMAQPYVSGQAISFDGMRVDIQGAPSGGDKFTVSPSTNESVFKTIENLITALNTPISAATVNGMSQLTNSLGRGLNNLDHALNNVLTTRSSLGLRLNEIDALQATGEDLGLQYKQALSELQDVDYNKALSDLTQQQTYLQAAQKSFSMVSNLSLFSYI